MLSVVFLVQPQSVALTTNLAAVKSLQVPDILEAIKLEGGGMLLLGAAADGAGAAPWLCTSLLSLSCWWWSCC